MEHHHLRTDCRGCGGAGLDRFLELGDQPLANRFLRTADEAEDELFFPLDVYRCRDCSLVQLLDVISAEVLFRDYIYVTGTSETMARHNEGYARAVVQELGLGPDDLVVEAASNDGSLLLQFKEHGVRTLGVEPARNIAALARERGVDTIDEFFGHDFAQDLRRDRGMASVVIGNNVLAHVDDTRGFLAGARELIDAGGRVVTEFPYLGEFIERGEYDTVYHEHLCYFSVVALLRLYAGVGLSIVRVDQVKVHGGSLRVWAARREGEYAEHAPAVLALADEERARGLDDAATYAAFAERVVAQRRSLRGLLEGLRSGGKSIAAYGAPAKGNTLLNYCDIGRELVDFTVDRSPHKVGLLTPGVHLPVLPVATLVERQPDYCLILAWNFADEIMRQQAAYAEAGGRFILPIPEPRIV
jgi:C-methyltransferase-like protein/putative zinc binding protein/methyltransferase family protein